MAAATPANSKPNLEVEETEQSELSESLSHGPGLSHSGERFRTANRNKHKKISPQTGLRKDVKNSGQRSKGGKKGNNATVAKFKDSKQSNEPKNKNLNVVKKIISTFKRSNSKKEVNKNHNSARSIGYRENADAAAGPENQQVATTTSSPEVNNGLQEQPDELDEDLEDEDQRDYDNIDTENIRVPLKTIAINELLFPKNRFNGGKTTKPKRRKDYEIGPKPSDTSMSTKATIEDSNIVSVNSYCDWDDGLDTLSVRTEDIFTNDGELVPSFNNVNDDASICTDPGQVLSATNSRSTATSISKYKISKEKHHAHATPTRTIHSHVITPFRLNKTNWNVAYESLTIRKCVENIQPEKLTLSIPTLTSLKFAQLSSFQVISCCLRSFHNLKRLSFSNVALVQKKSYNENDPRTINLPNVTELEMVQWLSSLTKYDYWLLEVFTRSVSFGKLESFTFRGSDFVVGEKALAKCHKLLENIRDTAVVVRFLVKHRVTLKKVSIGGIGFKMMEHYQGANMEQELGKVNHIHDFRINLSTFGIDILLLNQKHIQNLTFTGYVTDFEEAYTNLVRKCIENNRSTLSSLGIFPCIVSDGIRPFYGSLTPYYFNCGIFESCLNLKSLFLNITAAQKMFTKRFSCGKVTNLHLLPKNLSTIEIYNHDFDPGDLEKFGQNFFRYRCLHRLVLSSITANKYSLRVEWIKFLFSLPSFERADFFGGKLESARMFRDYITSKPPGFITMIQISDCISFYKPHLYTAEEEKENKEISQHTLRSLTAPGTSSRRSRTRSNSEERPKSSS